MQSKVRYLVLIMAVFGLTWAAAAQVCADVCETHYFFEVPPGGPEDQLFDENGYGWDMNAENDMKVTSIETLAYLKLVGGGTAHIQLKINGRVVASWDHDLFSVFAPHTHEEVVDFQMRVGDTITYFIYSDPSRWGYVLSHDDNKVEFCGPEGIFGVPGCPSCNLLLLD